MNDMVQNPEAQKLAQMLQQQQMQKLMQGFQGAATNADTQMMQAAQPTYNGMDQMGQMPQTYQNNGSVPMLGGNMQQQNMQRSAPAANMAQGQGAMSNKDLEMMRRMPK